MRNNEHTRALLPCRGWSAEACIASQSLPSIALLCTAAVLCSALHCSALYSALCPALLTLFRSPIPQRQGRQIQPAGRRAWMRDVFVRDMDVPYKNFCRTCAPVARSASGARTGCAFFWLLFFAQAKKSDSRPKGVKALLPASSCIKENTQPRGTRTKKHKNCTHLATKQPVNRSTGQPTHTFNNKNSRSHELITRKNVSYSFRFTEI
ncbi:hypothetical protein FHY25_001380 [Xanthomonas arboricola]|nr:hypothetical protein [Xanthomonas campestris]MCW2006799.1 hypothetical protein [Xanthomonas campestris]